MRTFETLLLAASTFFLLLNFRNPPKAVLGGVAGINLLLLLVHGLVEGFRWQMGLAYVTVALLAVAALAKASGRFTKAPVPRGLKGVTTGICVVLFAITAILASAIPVFTLPAPTGDYPVGVTYLRLTDEKRADPFRDKVRQPRALMVKVYYPARPDDAKSYAAYFHGSTRFARAFAAFYQMPGFLFDHLTLIKTFAREDLEPSDRQANYPVVLFSHGAGHTMEVETAQSEDLASHGYVVVDVDHPYVSAATEFPDRIVTAREATTNFDTPEPAEPITQIMADDDRFVLEKLAEMNRGAVPSAFKARLNLDAVGVMGHSVGGAAAYNLAINDRRIKAAINLDGAVYVAAGDSRRVAPFLMLASDRYHAEAIQNRQSLMKKLDSSPESQQEMRDMYGSKAAYDTAYGKAQRNVRGLAEVLKKSGTLYTIDGSDHMKFTDIGLFIGAQWLRKLLQIGGKTDPARCLAITQAVTVAFFDQHLKGQPADALSSLPKTCPELKKINLN